MLTARDLANARTDVSETLFETAYITRPSGVTDAAGATIETFGTVGTVNARIDPLKAMEANPFYGEQEAGKALYQLTMPYNTDLKVTDVVEVNGIRANVLQVHDEHSDRIVIRAVCAKVGD
jgi:head-tail adaptor